MGAKIERAKAKLGNNGGRSLKSNEYGSLESSDIRSCKVSTVRGS
jgi:hypothetical protein